MFDKIVSRAHFGHRECRNREILTRWLVANETQARRLRRSFVRVSHLRRSQSRNRCLRIQPHTVLTPEWVNGYPKYHPDHNAKESEPNLPLIEAMVVAEDYGESLFIGLVSLSICYWSDDTHAKE